MLTPAPGNREHPAAPGHGPAGGRSAGRPLMTAAADVRVEAARDRLAEIPADDVLVTLDARTLAAVAGKAVMAAQLLDAYIRDTDRNQGPGRGGPAVTLDGGQAALVLAALDDAASLRREVGVWCRDCQASPAGLCADHGASLEAAGSYDRLRRQLEAGGGADSAGRDAGWEATS